MPARTESATDSMRRGSEDLIHKVSMLARALMWASIIGLILGSIVAYFDLKAQLDEYEFYLIETQIKAFFMSGDLFGARDVWFILPDGSGGWFSWNAIYEFLDEIPAGEKVKTQLAYSAMLGGVVALGVVFLYFAFVYKRGGTMMEDLHLRGSSIVDAKTLAQMVKKAKKASKITIAGIPRIIESETMHTMIAGSTGGGKTVAASEQLDQYRADGWKMLIYDPKPEFIRRFYRPGDIILNPFDTRTEYWSPFSEIRSVYDFDIMAQNMVPMPPETQDKYWIEGARTVLSVIMQYLAKTNQASNANLVDAVIRLDKENLAQILDGTEAGRHVDIDAPKTSAGILSSAVNAVKGLKFYDAEGKKPFSLSAWMADESDQRTVFITSKAKQQETLSPIIAAQINTAADACVDLPEDKHRKIGFIFEELPTIARLTKLENLMRLGRDRGARVVIMFQMYSQLKTIYGPEVAKTLVGLCNTKLVFRVPEPETAKWLSDNLGQEEIHEAQEGSSQGVNTQRDGMNISNQRKEKAVVLPSEILNLADNHGFLFLPGPWPVASFEQKPKDRPIVCEAIEERADAAVIVGWARDAAPAADVPPVPQEPAQASTVPETAPEPAEVIEAESQADPEGEGEDAPEARGEDYGLDFINDYLADGSKK